MFLGAKVRRFLQSHNTFSMLFAYHKHGILPFFDHFSPKNVEMTYPQAEWSKAGDILMHTPGQELFCGVIHP